MKCKECNFNNNGWCKKYKTQKPKAMILCEEDVKYSNKESENLAYMVNGKMQQLLSVVKQVDAMPSFNKNEFKEVLKGLYQYLEIEIKIQGINMDYETDKYMLEDLRYRIKKW